MSLSDSPLDDFPLHDQDRSAVPSPLPPLPQADADPESGSVASLSARFTAAAADAAAVLLMTALAILSARLWAGASPRLTGLLWAGVFVLYLSAFATIVPLVAFGRTVGMALADLSARGGGRPGVPAGAALRRWLATLATAATGGLLLLWTARSADAPTPADRLSGCALTVD